MNPSILVYLKSIINTAPFKKYKIMLLFFPKSEMAISLTIQVKTLTMAYKTFGSLSPHT